MRNHIKAIKSLWDAKAGELLSQRKISKEQYQLILIENQKGMERAIKQYVNRRAL